MTESFAFRRRKASAAALLLLPVLLLSACGSAIPKEESVPEEESGPPPQLIDTVYPDWHAKDIYTEGDIVIHDGKYFRARWWTRNDPPSEDSSGVWTCLGDVPHRAGTYFDDVHDDAWYAAAINTLTEDGILTGWNDGRTFQPSRTVTRAQFAVMLCRALDIAPVEGGDNFSDAGDTWYTPYLAALKQRGFSGGTGDNCFSPDRQITRQELCKLIYDACDGFSEDPVTAFAPYTDAEDVSAWAIRPLSWCIERGILQGSGDRLLPERTASRAEAAQVLYNLRY